MKAEYFQIMVVVMAVRKVEGKIKILEPKTKIQGIDGLKFSVFLNSCHLH
jgi:hypothetical protein